LTPDCAAAARAEATFNLTTTKLQSRGHVFYSLQSTEPHGDSSDAQCYSGSFHQTHHSWEKDGYPTHLDRLTYFQTHGELHKGPCTFSLPVRELDLPVISLGTSALLLHFIFEVHHGCSEAPASFCSAKPCQTRCQGVEVTKD